MRPLLRRRHPAIRTGDQLTRGERAADAARNGMGSWRFIIGQTVVVAAWIAGNIYGWQHQWDPYPFILLNLAFSTQAAYAAPLVLLSQRRQDQQAGELAAHDYECDRAALAAIRHNNAILTAIATSLGVAIPPPDDTTGGA